MTTAQRITTLRMDVDHFNALLRFLHLTAQKGDIEALRWYSYLAGLRHEVDQS